MGLLCQISTILSEEIFRHMESLAGLVAVAHTSLSGIRTKTVHIVFEGSFFIVNSLLVTDLVSRKQGQCRECLTSHCYDALKRTLYTGACNSISLN